MITGRSATGIIHLVNQTPIDWYSKRQATVETATYGSEFVAARIATEQIVDLRITLRSLGVPIEGPSWMFGDNKSVVTSGTIPHSTLSKRHNALAYHKVREAVAAEILYFVHVSTKQNVADALTKFLPYPVWHPIVDPLLFRAGDTLTKDDVEELYEQKVEVVQAVQEKTDNKTILHMSVMDELNLDWRPVLD